MQPPCCKIHFIDNDYRYQLYYISLILCNVIFIKLKGCPNTEQPYYIHFIALILLLAQSFLPFPLLDAMQKAGQKQNNILALD